MNNFRKNDDPHSWCISEIRDSKRQVRSMSNNSRFREQFEKQHGNQPQRLAKYERQHLYHVYSSLWRQFSWKKPLLVICKILTLFVNTLTPDDTYCLLIRDTLTQLNKMQLSQKQKTTSNFFLPFWNLV